MHQQHNMSCMAAVQGHGVAPSGSTCGTALSVQGVTWVGLIYAKIYLIIFFNLKMPVFEGKMYLAWFQCLREKGWFIPPVACLTFSLFGTTENSFTVTPV